MSRTARTFQNEEKKPFAPVSIFKMEEVIEEETKMDESDLLKVALSSVDISEAKKKVMPWKLWTKTKEEIQRSR